LNLWQGILLGIIQGLTEFLPVSSSGHLVIAQSIMKGFHQQGVLFDVMLHVGTLAAVFFFLWNDVSDILKSLVPKKWHPNPGTYDDITLSSRRKTAFLIVIGTIFTGSIGIAFKDSIHRLFESVEIAAAMLLVTGILLFFADRVKNTVRTEGDMTITDAVIIGIVQGMALLPGISRSGSTIAFGMFRHINGETAARFSFLLSIPAIIGAMILELGYVKSVSHHEIIVYTMGMITAAVTGFLALKLLFFMIKKRELRIFAYYCWFLGIATLIIKAI
jgi:undecaprenyl-diphosphatase